MLDSVEDFIYLGSLISKDNGAKKDTQSRLGKSRGAFARLQPIWKSKQYSLRTKLRVYNSNVKSVLLYGSECWRVVKADMAKISAFHSGCLRKICHIFWPQKVSNEDLYRKVGCEDILREIKNNLAQNDPDRTKANGFVLGQAQKLARDHQKWRRRVAALFPTREEEDK